MKKTKPEKARHVRHHRFTPDELQLFADMMTMGGGCGLYSVFECYENECRNMVHWMPYGKIADRTVRLRAMMVKYLNMTSGPGSEMTDKDLDPFVSAMFAERNKHFAEVVARSKKD